MQFLVIVDLPFACSPSLLSQRTSSLPRDTPRANPPSLTTPFSGSQSFTVIEGGSHFVGEGEFGRVVLGKALDIAGSGYTKVAVKMLKSHSSAYELQDLLTEYCLLK